MNTHMNIYEHTYIQIARKRNIDVVDTDIDLMI